MKWVTYLINLDSSQMRLANANEQLTAAGFDFERISAFDGRGLNPLEMEEYDHQKTLSYMGRGLKGGEIGCYYSHMECVQRFLQTDAQYAFVFEDDMQLIPNAKKVIECFLGWLEIQDLDWYLLNIGAQKQKIFTPIYEYRNYQLVHAHYFPMLAIGLVWSRKGAQTFVEQHYKIQMPVDNYFRLWLTKNNKGLSVFPPLIVEAEIGKIQSDIDDSVKRQFVERSFWYGLAKQKRLWRNKYHAFMHKWLRPWCYK